MKRIALYCFNNSFTADTGTKKIYIPLPDEVNAGEPVSTHRAIHFSSSDCFFTYGSTIYDLTLNSASSSASTLVESNIGSQNTVEK